MDKLPPEYQAKWREMLDRDPVVQAVFSVAATRIPTGYNPSEKNQGSEDVALRAAHCEGIRAGIQTLKDIAFETNEPAESPYLDTSKN